MKPGDRIRKEREEMGLSPESLGEKLGMTGPAVRKWEKNQGEPSDQSYKKLSNLFKKSISYLKTGSDFRAIFGEEECEIEKTDGPDEEDTPTEKMLLQMLVSQQVMMREQRQDVSALVKVVEAQRQDMADLTKSLTAHLDRIGGGKELAEKRLEKRILELEAEIARLKREARDTQLLEAPAKPG